MDVIYCAGGGKILADIAIDEGFLYGSRSDDIREFPRCNGLIDINWKKYKWEDHIDAVRIHNPKYAVVPDIVDDKEIDKALEMAKLLEEECERVIIVPKQHGIVSKIPIEYIIGVSVPTKYAGFIPYMSELKGREIHLLGGSPNQQRELWKYYKLMEVYITSIDVNCHNKVSSFGKYWDGYKWAFDGKYSIDKYEAFRRSCKGIMGMWRELNAL